MPFRASSREAGPDEATSTGKTTMRIERALKIRDKAETALHDLFSAARTCGMVHSKMLRSRNEVFQRLGVFKSPNWVRAYLDGVWNTLQKHAYRVDLVYGALIDGKFYSTHSNRPDYYEANGIVPSAFADSNPTKGHYWASNLKPFFVSEMPGQF